MSQLRLNAATGDWVLVANERGDRPHAYREHAERPPAPDYEKSCPFCPGNRDETPHFQIALPESGFVRVLPNKFPAVSAGLVPKPNASLFERHMPAGGCHDVVVDNPRHNFRLAEGSEPELHAVVHAWRDRYRQLASDPHTRHVVVFKNYGVGAGSSLPHPHSQIVSLPVLPSQVRLRVETAMNVSNTLGRCVFCCMLEHEREAETRIVETNGSFTAFVPYAAYSPFSVWILPHRHCCDFARIEDHEMADLSKILHSTLKRVSDSLGNPDYNLVIRSAVPATVGEDYFHWYISIVPRLQKAAGFELGTGMFINTSLPEEDAAFLREH